MLISINPDVTEQLIGQFQQQATALSDLTNRLDSEVNNHIGSGKDGWQGHQADEFNSHWNSDFKTSLTRLHEALEQAQGFLNSTLTAYRQLDHQA
jgi:WXG100 family type VII secretion target